MQNTNKILTQHLPNFSHIKIDTIVETLTERLQTNRNLVKKLLDQPNAFQWNNLMQPLEEMSDELNKLWSPIGHLHGVLDSKPLREAYNACIPLLSDYNTELAHNKKLFDAIESIANNKKQKQLDKAQQKIIHNEIRDFKLAGVALSDEKKKLFAKLSKELSQLTTQFEENVLDATMGFTKLITDKNLLSGIPKHAIEAAAKQNKEGWVFTLEFPSYYAVICHADSRQLRKEMYTAYCTRASDQGPNANKWDNSKVMQNILEKRLELANLLDFKNYAEMSLATKMVKEPSRVLNFLQQLVEAAHDSAKKEFKELAIFAKETLNLTDLTPWDVAYASEKLREQRYAISQEELRPYFPEYKTLSGLFTIVQRLFNVRIEELCDFDRYHPDVRCFALFNKNNELQSLFYMDLYARENKRGGAWMDDCRVRRHLDNGQVQIPVAYINCNFNAPVGNDPALFSHDDVVTLFHEFGHGLQHMLTQVNYADVSGINGIPWDAVEIASQFLENWAWEKDAIEFIAEHYKSKEPLPTEMFNKMIRAKNFQSAMGMMRQLEFSLFDFRLHMEFDPSQNNQIQSILNEIREAVTVTPVAEFNRFQHGFSHIFAGGYAAGYYSYKWAEVMASDAFSLFMENGVFDAKTSQKFLQTFLESGGVEDPLDLFIQFRGREPSINALLQQSGITRK